MRRIGIGVTTLTLLASFAAAQAAERERVCLNGVWQFSPGQIDQEALAADATFYDVPVPSFWDRMEEFGVAPSWPKELARGWYRRAFSVDRAWQGRRVLLTFDAVRYVAEVFVNGKSMGTHIDGFAPLVLDVTDAVRFDGSNDLLVKVTNWKGLLYPDAKDMEFPLFKDVRYAFAFFAPPGLPPRVGNQAGIWQDVWLEAVPVRRIERVKIETSVKDRLLTVRTWTAGEKAEGSRVRHEVLDGEKVVLTAEGAAPGAVEAKWAEAKLWWPHDPHLYHLRTRLLDGAGQVIDEITTRFGFREIGIDGKHVYFNGERLNLRADNYVQIMDAAGMLAMRKEYAKMLFELMKRCNINAVRLHGNPSPPSTLDAADEVGMLILNESATYGSESHMRVEDPLFQKNNLRHLEAWIQRDWNHPSVIAWSLANEFSAPVEHFRAMHELAKRLDPTRIAYNDGDFADVWCGHYTWDWTRTPQLPNTAYWFGDEEWVKRTLGKSLDEICIPHFVDEFYNVDTTARSLSPSVFFGPDVDKVPHQAKRDLHFHALRYVAEGARYTDLAEINPFCLIAHFWSFCVSGATLSWPDPTAPGVKPTHPGAMTVNPHLVAGPPLYNWNANNEDVRFAYSPMYAYTRQYAHTFWSGETVGRRITCFNDDLRPLAKVVRWSATVDGKEIAKGEHAVGSKIGFRDEFDVAFTLPEVAARTEGALKLAVDVAGEQVFENTIGLVVFPKASTMAQASGGVGLWRVSDDDRKALEALGVTGTAVETAGDLEGLKVLILGRDAAGQDGASRFYEAVAKFVDDGGCAIGLFQSNAWWMPGRLSMDGESWSTIAFPNGEHPVTAGLKNEDLRFWGEDHVVARSHMLMDRLPEAARAVVVAGSPMGLAYTPLVEYPYGAGVYLLCQMPVLEKSATEGAAGTLMRNMVGYGLRRDVAATAAEPFVYRQLWEAEIPLAEALPAEPPNDFRLDVLSQVYGSDEPVLGWYPKDGFSEWVIKGIPDGVREVNLQCVVRTGDDGDGKPYRYTVTVNGDPVAMQDEYEYVRETFDSAQGWRILRGSTSSLQPVKLRNGDRLRITCHQAWSAIVQVILRGELSPGSATTKGTQ